MATILLVGVDLFFRGKLEGLLADHQLVTKDSADPPDLVICDIARIDPLDVADIWPDIPILGYLFRHTRTRITKRNLLRLCSGWDKMVFWQGLNWLLSAQLFWEHIFDYPGHRDNYLSNVGLTKAYQDEITWTFYTNTDIMNERIKFDNLFLWNQMKHDGWNRFKVGFDLSDKWSCWIGNNFFWGRDHSPEINPFVGTTTIRDGTPFSPLNPDADTLGRVRRGGALGEMKRNTSFFWELKYLF